MSGFEARSRAALADPHKRANVPRFAEKAADNRARQSGPWCSKKRLSSAATNAVRRNGGMSCSGTASCKFQPFV